MVEESYIEKSGLFLWAGHHEQVTWLRFIKDAPERGKSRVSGGKRGPWLTWESAVNSADAIAWSLGFPS